MSVRLHTLIFFIVHNAAIKLSGAKVCRASGVGRPSSPTARQARKPPAPSVKVRMGRKPVGKPRQADEAKSGRGALRKKRRRRIVGEDAWGWGWGIAKPPGAAVS